jgi:DnaJ-class molecular chaperone
MPIRNTDANMPLDGTTKKGNLMIKFEVQYPTYLDPKQKKLILQALP